RPGPRRSPASVYPASRVLGAAAMSTDKDGAVLLVEGLHKTFTLHTQGGIQLPVLRGVDLAVYPGECVALTDPSGSGKSTLLRAIYATSPPQAGRILVVHDGERVDMVS